MTTESELERELEQLGEAVRPLSSVADRVMQRINADEADLIVSLVGRLRRTYHTMKPIRKLLYAAASLTIVAGLIWALQSGTGNGLAWADVLQNIQEARTMTGWSTHGSSQFRFFLKDPGLSRSERYDGMAASKPALGGLGPSAIEIGKTTDAGPISVAWEPHGQWVSRRRSVGCPRSLRSEVALYWTNLKTIGSDDVHKVGEEWIDEVETAVFEAPIQAALEGIIESTTDSGTVRVWVSKETKVPVRVAMGYRSSPEESFDEMVTHLEWNVPLDDALFEIPQFDDERTTYDSCTVCFSNQILRPGVKVSLGPASGQAIVTEADIERIGSGNETLQDPPGEVTRRDIAIEWTRTAADRIAAYTEAHPDEALIIEFNGQIQNEIKKQWTVPGATEAVRVDIKPLGITLEQFEQDYLTDEQ